MNPTDLKSDAPVQTAATETPFPLEHPPAKSSAPFQLVASRLQGFRDQLVLIPHSQAFVFISSISVRYKIAGALILILALAIASLGMVTFSRQKKILEQEMERRAEVLVQQLANVGKEGLLTQEELATFSAIKDLQKNAGVAYAMILDGKGQVFVHSVLAEKGKQLPGPVDRNAAETQRLLFQEALSNGEPVLDAALPIVSKVKSLRVGTARIGLSKKELVESIHRQKMIFFWISMGFVAIGLLISFGLAKVLTQPIYTLAVAMQVVARGDLSQQVKVFARDEIGKLSEAFNQMILSLREKLHMEKYLSYSTLRSIKKSRDAARLKLGGENKYVTALFSDVRGFTALSEKLKPEEVVALLNIYLNLQSKVVHQRHGTVDKFVGDEVMAIFEGEGQELNAVRAAFEIQRFVQALNGSRAKRGRRQMQVGIGLNSGEVVMGNMGSEEQMSYTVIGDNINLAARLCGVARSGQVVVSKSVAEAVSKQARMKKLDPVQVKGKDKPIEIYEVQEVSGVARRTMRRGVEVGASYHLEGLAEEKNRAGVHNLGPGGCLLEVPLPIGIGSRLYLDLDAPHGKDLSGLLAVVRHMRKHDSKYFIGVSFQELGEEAQHDLVEWVHLVETEIVPS